MTRPPINRAAPYEAPAPVAVDPRVVQELANFRASIDQLKDQVKDLIRNDQEQGTGLKELASAQLKMVEDFKGMLTEQRQAGEVAREAQEDRWRKAMEAERTRTAEQQDAQTKASLEALQKQAFRFFGEKVLGWIVTLVGAAALAGAIKLSAYLGIGAK